VVRWALVIAFAVAVGHLAWHALVGPTFVPEYQVGGEGPALTGLDPEHRHLYLRRELYLSRRPRRAWLQVIGRDRLRVYVNGRFVGSQALPGFPVAVVADPTPYLQVGRNVIAVSVEQCTLRQPPVVAVDGAYAFDDHEEHRIQVDSLWRCRATFERKAAWWFETHFDDRHWPYAPQTTCALRATVGMPPRALTVAGTGRWITPQASEDGSACVCREFHVAGRPRQAWLRLTSTGSYRVALNGILLDEQEDELGATVSAPPVQRSYDITAVAQRGRNVLALVLTDSTGRTPHVLADVEVEGGWGRRVLLGTDKDWLGRPGRPHNWLAAAPDGSSEWRPCLVEVGDLRVPPWQPRRQPVELVLPCAVVLQRAVGQLALIGLVAVLTFLACNAAVRRMVADVPYPTPFVFLALLPPTLAIAAALLATCDPRVLRQDVYQAIWVLLAVASVPLQWRLLAWLRDRQPVSGLVPAGLRPAARPSWIAALLLGLVVIGFLMRLRDVGTEGLQWDEVENYHATLGFLERGFPNIKVHDDLPRMYIHTSELQFIPMALAALAFNDSAYVVRFPAVCWSTLTIVLIYLVGRRLCSVPVGLLAATIYTFAPVCVSMSNFGRYFSQLQFFTLLTVYCFWLTIRGTGPINRRALWLTAASFLGMFLTWEASALLAPALVLAALEQRRGRLRTMLGAPAVWAAMLVVGLVVMAQTSHVVLQHTQFLWYGVSLSDVKLIPMWRYPNPGVFQPWFYIWQASWNQDALLPLLGLAGALVVATGTTFRRPVRFLLIIHLATCLVMAFLLPNAQWRYIHHLVPLPILLTAAALVVGARALARWARTSGVPAAWHDYANGVVLLVVITLTALGSGMTVELGELPWFRIQGHGQRVYKFPNLQGTAQYLRAHMQEGDVVLANNLYQVNHLMGITGRPNRPLDFMPATGPFLPATLDDRRPLLLDRRDGVQMISTPEGMVDLFARHRRIWYVVQPGQHYILNTPDVSTFLRQHTDVVYEDWEALVLFRGDNHRPASLRVDNERALRDAQANFLP
jgi:hypothetical protein